jgi:hypothetical protein
MTHRIRFVERTLASVRCECVCGWKAEVLSEVVGRQNVLNAKVARHFDSPNAQRGN